MACLPGFDFEAVVAMGQRRRQREAQDLSSHIAAVVLFDDVQLIGPYGPVTSLSAFFREPALELADAVPVEAKRHDAGLAMPDRMHRRAYFRRNALSLGAQRLGRIAEASYGGFQLLQGVQQAFCRGPAPLPGDVVVGCLYADELCQFTQYLYVIQFRSLPSSSIANAKGVSLPNPAQTFDGVRKISIVC